MLLAFFFRSRTAAFLSVLAMSTVLFIKTANVIIFQQMYSIVCYGTCKILLAHADHHSLKILIGPFYYIWISGGIILVLYLICCASVIAVKNIRRKMNESVLNGIRVALLLILLISIGANAKYTRECYDEYGKYHFKSEYVARPAFTFGVDLLHERKKEAAKIYREKQFGFFPEELPESSRILLSNWGLLHPQKSYPIMEKPFTKIVVIALESMDLANIHAYNPAIPRDVTPNLDKLSGSYLSFRNYFTASQPTSWGLNAMFLSRVDYEADLNLDTVSVYDLLQEQGYQGYYLSPVNGMFADNRVIYEKQFRPQHVLFLEELNRMFGIQAGEIWGISDDDMYKAALNIIQQMNPDEKFFMTVSTIDTHPPYNVSGPLKTQLHHASPFLNSVRCADQNLQDFLDQLMQTSAFDDQMLIIITADHSATHGENYNRRVDFAPDRIPLIFITRNNWFASAFPFDTDKLCSQIDLPVTLLNLLGIQAPPTFMGDNLLTKKSFAFTKSPQTLTLLLPENREISWSFAQDRSNATLEEAAVYDFYDRFYGFDDSAVDSQESTSLF